MFFHFTFQRLRDCKHCDKEIIIYELLQAASNRKITLHVLMIFIQPFFRAIFLRYLTYFFFVNIHQS